MMTWNIIAVALLALIPSAFAQNPIDAMTRSVQEQINTMGQQLQQSTVQHIVEGNLTGEHISRELNATKQNLTEKAREKLNQELNESLNLAPEQLQQNATEELKRQVNQRVPGFESLIALIGLLGVILVKVRKN
jgi:DNA-binding protein YbaB